MSAMPIRIGIAGTSAEPCIFRAVRHTRATMLTQRKRLSPEESRDAALEAARALLIEDGPQAVTLKAVAARVGRTHANLLHHFGSAAGLQKALIASLAQSVTAEIGDAVLRARAGALALHSSSRL